MGHVTTHICHLPGGCHRVVVPRRHQLGTRCDGACADNADRCPDRAPDPTSTHGAADPTSTYPAADPTPDLPDLLVGGCVLEGRLQKTMLRFNALEPHRQLQLQ